jgi:hypothetical protein
MIASPNRTFAAFRVVVGLLVFPLAALVVPGSAEAATQKLPKPMVTKVSPTHVSIGEMMTIYGRYFVVGRARNTVAFKRDGAPAIFAKPRVSTKRKLFVVVPDALAKYLKLKDGVAAPTVFRLRVLAKRFGTRFTSVSKSLVVSSTAPDGDCDGDGIKNSSDPDDDNDLLSDDLEKTLKTDPCNADTDGDGVQDGYEYKSAVDLNDDEYQQPNNSLPYPGTRPYPNPLDGSDANTDFDGDSLSLIQEYKLWVYTTSVEGQPRTLEPLAYSDGLQYSVYQRVAGRRKPALAATGYNRQQEFLAWANSAGYGTVYVQDPDQWWYQDRPAYNILDVNRDGVVSTVPDLDFSDGAGYFKAESTYYDADQDGFLSDGERDEDADGLTNFDEGQGCTMSRERWQATYTKETPYPVAFAGTQLDNADSDGDGVRDGADDQDHDDVPNLWECHRQAASGRPFDDPNAQSASSTPLTGFVNPFNPCLPSTRSRSCNRNPNGPNPWAPFNTKDVYYLVLN